MTERDASPITSLKVGTGGTAVPESIQTPLSWLPGSVTLRAVMLQYRVALGTLSQYWVSRSRQELPPHPPTSALT